MKVGTLLDFAWLGCSQNIVHWL